MALRQSVRFNNRSYQCVCVDAGTQSKHLLELMLDKWKWPPPDILISLAGGERGTFSGSPAVTENLERSILAISSTPHVWTLSSAANTGVWKFVGDAVKKEDDCHRGLGIVTDHCLHAIGIGTWSTAETFKHSKLIKQAEEKEMSEEKLSPAILSSGHTHFIMVDIGVNEQSERISEGKVRTMFEQAMSRQFYVRKDDCGVHSWIRSALVLVAGAKAALEHVCEAVGLGIPVVIVQDSGGVADLLCLAVQFANESQSCQLNEGHRQRLEAFAKQIAVVPNEQCTKENMDQLISTIEHCLDNKKRMYFVNLANGPDLDQAVLGALLDADGEASIEHLSLALTWNRKDIAETDILPRLNWPSAEALHHYFFQALVENKPDFVLLFVEKTPVCETFLSKENLIRIYEKAFSCPLMLAVIRKLRLQKITKGELSVSSIDLVYEKLLGRNFLRYQACYTEGEAAKQMEDDNRPDVVEDCSMQLMLWAIMADHPRVAHSLWKKTAKPIAAALLACLLLQRLARQLRKSVTLAYLQEEVKMTAEQFETNACRLLSICESHDELMSKRLIREVLPRWSNSTCLGLARESEAMVFMSHAVCQTLLSEVWMGGLHSQAKKWKIFVGIVFPPTIPLLLRGSTPLCTVKRRTAEFIVREQAALPDGLAQSKLAHGEDRCFFCVSNRQRTCARHESSQANYDQAQEDKKGTTHRRTFAEAPVVKFYKGSLSLVIFSVLFSYTLLVPWTNCRPTLAELVVLVWVVSMLTAEMRQFVLLPARSWREKLRRYVSDDWSCIHQIAIWLYLTQLIWRYDCSSQKSPDGVSFELSRPDENKYARTLCSLSAIFFIFSLLEKFRISPFGPKMQMFKQMFGDGIHFFIMLFTAILCFGVASHSLLFTNTTVSWSTITNILYMPYFQIHGELFFEKWTDDGTQDSSDTLEQPVNRSVAIFLLGTYLFICNILVVNLIIAVFTSTYEKVHTRAVLLWQFKRYDLILEHLRRSELQPPFDVIDLLRPDSILWEKCFRKDANEIEHALAILPTKAERRQMECFQQTCLELLLSEEVKSAAQESKNTTRIVDKLQLLEKKLDRLTERLDQLVDHIKHPVHNNK